MRLPVKFGINNHLFASNKQQRRLYLKLNLSDEIKSSEPRSDLRMPETQSNRLTLMRFPHMYLCNWEQNLTQKYTVTTFLTTLKGFVILYNDFIEEYKYNQG